MSEESLVWKILERAVRATRISLDETTLSVNGVPGKKRRWVVAAERLVAKEYAILLADLGWAPTEHHASIKLHELAKEWAS